MKVQVVYALVASENDLFIEEIWCSIYSLRLYEPDRDVIVCCNASTAARIRLFPKLEELITKVVVIPIPNDYNTPKLVSRQIKTSIRQYITGPYLFVDTDTVFCGNIEDIDHLTCDISAVLEYHIPLSQSPFRYLVTSNLKQIFSIDVSNDEGWHNSGVLYVADNETTREFYKRWNMNWRFSALEKKMSQDQPALMKTDKELGYIIKNLPDIYNCQPAMSVKYLANAKIIHFLHMYFPSNQSYCPFMDKSFYQKLHDAKYISPGLSDEIKNVKLSFDSPTCVVGWETMNFMTSPAFPIFEKIYNEGGAASWLMMKFAKWIDIMHNYTKK